MGRGSKSNAECFCYNCDRWFHYLGIATHRAMHRRKQEKVEILYSSGIIKTHDYRPST